MPQRTIGAFQKGQPGSLEFAAYNFGGGLNVKDVPQMIADEELSVAYNGYLRQGGGFQGRFGMTLDGGVLGSTSTSIDGLARFYSVVYNGSNTGLPSTRTLAQVNGRLVDVASNTDYGSIGGASAFPWTFVRATDPNDSNPPGYVNGNPSSVIVICTGSGGPYIYDGVTLYTPAGWSNAASARWCALVNGVIWFGGIPGQPNTVYGSGDGVSASMETLPGYNVFVFSQPITGLSAFGTGATAALVVGMNVGISVLTGTGPATYNLQDVPSADGVRAGRSMIYYQGMMFYLGKEAIYAFDGFDPPVQISQKVEPWILNDPEIPGYPMAGDTSKAFAFIHDNRLHFGYATQSGGVNDTMLCFDLVQQGWTVLQATPGLNCACALDAPGDPTPFQIVAGSSTTRQCYNWDVEPTYGSNATDNGVGITVQFQTKYFKLGQPGTNKALMRAYPEFFLNGSFAATFTVYTNYGALVTNAITTASGVVPGSEWDVALWDSGIWSQPQGLLSFGPEASRIDFNGVPGEAFSFGLVTTSTPFVFGGLTGVFQQRGRT